MLLLSLVLFSIYIRLISAIPHIVLGNTSITGTEFTNIEFFGGIPYAEPPIGQLRFKPAVSKTLNVPTFNATSFGFSCLQPGIDASIASEDCLNVNIFRPAGLPKNELIPVMAWIYGGGFIGGSASLYNGTGIVAQSVARGTPVIYVNFNYRVGPFGFPQGAEAASEDALNLGLKDQLTALQWIQTNIGDFGGDKTKVTVFGQSAGATSINIFLYGSTISRLARATILESVPGISGASPEHHQAAWQNFVAAVPECAALAATNSTFACMRAVSTAALFTALTTAGISPSTLTFGPVIDGPGGLLPDIPSSLPLQARMPIILGTNLDEGTVFTPQTVNSTAAIRAFLLAAGPPSSALASVADAVINLYPDVPALGSPFDTGNVTFGLAPEFKQYAALFGDWVITSQRRLLLRALSKAGVPAFGYLFTDPDAVVIPGLAVPDAAPGSIGVSHSAEIDYVYGTLVRRTPTAVALSEAVRDYWLAFATGLDPNDGGVRIRWTRYTPDDESIIQLNGHNTTLIPDTFRARQIALINSVRPIFGR